MSAARTGFDRLELIDGGSPRRASTRQALFTSYEQAVPLGAVWLSCSSCRRRTPVTFGQALRSAVPSLHLPVLRRRYPSWMRCPACQRRTWVRLSLRAGS